MQGETIEHRPARCRNALLPQPLFRFLFQRSMREAYRNLIQMQEADGTETAILK